MAESAQQVLEEKPVVDAARLRRDLEEKSAQLQRADAFRRKDIVCGSV